MLNDYKGLNSLAIFSTLGSPFLETTNFQSHYHPSLAQSLTQEQRYTALSPSRLQHTSCPTSDKAETLSHPQLKFLPNSSYQDAKPTKSNSTSPFNESWPSTEHSSSSLTPEGAVSLPSNQALGTNSLGSPRLQDSVSDSGSVIARYIERFRYGEPTNRRTRRTNSDTSHFWWLGHSSLPEGNTSEKEESPSSDSSQSKIRTSLFSSELDQSPSGSSLDASTVDQETVRLQERANSLLQRSVSSSSNSRHISSEELEVTPITRTDVKVDWTRCTPQHLISSQQKGGTTTLPCLTTQISQAYSSLKLEDDILFQWRLRRKMEEASKAASVMPSLVWRSQYDPTLASNMVGKVVLKSPELTCRRSKDGNVFPICEAQVGTESTFDESKPCCCIGPVGKGPSSQQARETAVFRNKVAIIGRPELSEKQRIKESTPQQDSVLAYPNSCHLPKLTSSGEQRGKKTILQEEYVSVLPDSPLPPEVEGTTKSLSQRIPYHGQHIGPSYGRTNVEPRGNWRPCKSKLNQAKPVRDSREPPLSPAKHSVQQVLEEVVAERLFSPSRSPVPDMHKPKRSIENEDPVQALPGTVPTPSHPQLLDMAAKLLEQAEDSDGTEFEDDSLLQVLRGQREVLRRQLRAVDIQMGQLQGDNSDQNFSCR